MNTDKNGISTEGEKSVLASLEGAILNAASEVGNALGHGFLEAVYRRAHGKELQDRNLLMAEEVPFRVLYKGKDVGLCVADVVADGKVLVELKCADTLAPSHSVQVLNYLRASGLPVGLPADFGTAKIGYRRLVL